MSGRNCAHQLSGRVKHRLAVRPHRRWDARRPSRVGRTLVFTVVFAVTVCAGVAVLLLIEQLFAGGILW